MSHAETPDSDLILQIRQGDQAAAAELIRRYEPEIRRKIRTWLRLQNPELRRTLDSVDISQSVMGTFFLSGLASQYDLDDPGQLLSLLTVMARRKLIEQVRHQFADRRDVRRNQGDGALPLIPGPDATPSQHLAADELLAEFRRRLSEEEVRIADARATGAGWDQIAATLGGTAEGRRKQWARTLGRVTRFLGLNDPAS